MYLRAVADGGARYDLDGNPTGEVSSTDREWAANQMIAIDAARAKAKADAKSARVAAKANVKDAAKAKPEVAEAVQRQSRLVPHKRSQNLATKAAQGCYAAPVSGKALPEKPHVRPSSAAGGRPGGGLSLADLRAAAQARRAARA
jgi:sRNA-binding protein